MSTRSERRNRGGSLTDLLAEATGGPTEPASPPEARAKPREFDPRDAPQRKQGRGEVPSARGENGHVRQSDGSYVRADGARRVSLQLKMDPDDKRALKVQAAAAGLPPAEYVAWLVREDGRR